MDKLDDNDIFSDSCSVREVLNETSSHIRTSIIYADMEQHLPYFKAKIDFINDLLKDDPSIIDCQWFPYYEDIWRFKVDELRHDHKL